MKPHFYQEGSNFDSFYAKWLRSYYDVFLTFCSKIAKAIKADEVHLTYVKHWAKYCQTHVYGFPSPAEIAGDNDTLARVMAIYTWNNSVSLGSDHWSFAKEVSPVEKCLRIRRKPPQSRDEEL